MSLVASPVGALESAVGKARWRLIPLLSVCYLVAYMDRVNISFAAESMNRDLHFTPTIYGLGAGLFFLTYALCEIPSNRLLLHFGARRLLARIMLTWGLLAVGMAFVRSPGSFYGMRMLLGVAEAGYFPGVIFYLAQWFPKAERARAISLFYIAFPLSSVVMGGLAGVLLRQSGRMGLAGWQWLFLV
jgi:ACS family tartrate transporter-like MFS transporter